MTKNTTADILNAIKRAESVLVCGHIRPDGDCISSALAVRRICEKLGKIADAVCDCDKPQSFGFLPDYDFFCAPRLKKYDLFIAVDCANEKRLGNYVAFLQSADFSINIDHHPTNDGYCKINRIVPDACSTCAVLYDLFKDEGLIDERVATLLYTGLSTDTGHFMHSNTDDTVFNIAAELCRLGVNVGKINHDIYFNKSLQRIKLTARVIDGIRLYKNGQVALMVIGLDDLAACGCASEDTEGLIDYASSITGVKVSVAMCEQQGGLFRVSFRSVEADVAAAASAFGGGGHRLAAGCVINGNRYDVEEKVIAAASAAIDKLP